MAASTKPKVKPRRAARPRGATPAKASSNGKRKANKAGARAKSPSGAGRASKLARRSNGTVLLAGGNPQVAKEDGDAPVQAYIAAMPGWKSALGKRIDAVIERSFPHVKKAVKWNSPLYGVDGQTWFLGIHSYTRYVKVAFFRGAALKPPPPGTSKDPNTRYLDVHEHDSLDEAQLGRWVKQAAALPGWRPGKKSSS